MILLNAFFIVIGTVAFGLISSAGIWAIGAFSNNYNQSYNGKRGFIISSATGTFITVGYLFLTIPLQKLISSIIYSPNIPTALLASFLSIMFTLIGISGLYEPSLAKKRKINIPNTSDIIKSRIENEKIDQIIKQLSSFETYYKNLMAFLIVLLIIGLSFIAAALIKENDLFSMILGIFFISCGLIIFYFKRNAAIKIRGNLIDKLLRLEEAIQIIMFVSSKEDIIKDSLKEMLLLKLLEIETQEKKG